MKKKVTKEQSEWIVKLYEKHRSFKEVARITQYSIPTVTNHVKKAKGNGVTNKYNADRYKEPDFPNCELPILKENSIYKVRDKIVDTRLKETETEMITVRVMKEFPKLYLCEKINSSYSTCINKNDLYLLDIEEVS